MYTLWKPKEVEKWLLKSIELCDIKINRIIHEVFLQHSPGEDGWGESVSKETQNVWRNAT